jgi:hypothetical protein
MNVIYAKGELAYGYLNNYFESFLEDKIFEGDIEDYRDLTNDEYNAPFVGAFFCALFLITASVTI